MPHQSRRSTQRVAVNETVDAAPSIQPVAPSFVRADDSAARAADSLAQTLGITSHFAGRALERRREKASLSGTLAAIEGREPSEEERQSDSFVLAFEQISQERKLVDTRRELEQRIVTDFDSENGTLADLNQLIDKVFADSFGGLDPESDIDRVLAPEIARSLEDIRADMVAKFADQERLKLQDQVEADITALAVDDLERTGTIDYQDLNDRLLPLVGGQRTNEIVTSIAIDAAVSQGRPELLDSIPKTWASGAPGPHRLARFRDAIRNARIQAEAQQAHNERLAEASEREALKEARERNEGALMVELLNGREITSTVRDLIATGELSAETGRTLLNFQDSFAEDIGTGTVNDAEASRLEVGLFTGELTITDVIESAGNGRLGTGAEGKAELSRLLQRAATVKTIAEQRLSTPQYRTYQKELQTLLTPAKDAFGNPKPIELQRLANALRTYDELVSSGTAPLDARNHVLRQTQEATQVEPNQTTADDPDTLLQQLSNGTITEAEFDRRMSQLEASL